ncbi:MAG: YtfJ family protein [Rikenellaceae bacterium]|nr:YtfJ family protein [Rikenellaceae bacterium]
MKKILLLAVVALCGLEASAQLPAVTIRDSHDNPVPLPYFGEKHLLIFYVDPDHGNQNKEFTDYLEDNHIVSDNMYCFGIINLKDAPMLPNGVVRAAIRKKEKKNDVVIYTDPDHILRDAWQLGDVNNLFTIILVSRDRELVWIKKGKLGKAEQKEFFEVVEKYM